jgi:hypothetical protein
MRILKSYFKYLLLKNHFDIVRTEQNTQANKLRIQKFPPQSKRRTDTLTQIAFTDIKNIEAKRFDRFEIIEIIFSFNQNGQT